MTLANTAKTAAPPREWSSFHGSSVPLPADPFQAGQEFVRAVHHRLCQPLTALSCTLELMQIGRETDARLMEQLRAAVAQSDRIMEMTAAFRQLFEAGSPVTGHTSSLSAVLHEVVEDLRPLADHQRVTIVLRQRAEWQVNLTQKSLRQALWNLVQNCIEVTSSGKEVLIDANGECLTVLDSSGCSTTEMENVFDPFSFCANQLEVTKISNLPLAVMQRVLEAHGGSVSAVLTSRGRRFDICFGPVVPAANHS